MKMSGNMVPALKVKTTPGSSAAQDSSGVWRLQIPAGPRSPYRLAQLDDYTHLSRDAFPWQTPCSLSLQARASSSDILPGTWGFGFWNDPFSLSLGLGGSRRIPALPNTAWFFFASPPNYLSLRDDLPAQGSLAMTFRSPSWPATLLAPAGLMLPLAAIPAFARILRRTARRSIHQDTTQLQIDQSDWHSFQIDCKDDSATFLIDGEPVLQTPVTPLGPLGLVLWIDNQYAALPPDGRLRYGTLENPETAWIEIKHLVLTAHLR